MKPAAIARRDGVHQHYRQIRAYSCAAFFYQRPVEPPPKRSLCSKNDFALKGSAPAGVATPVRTDRAIMANTVVFMASSYEEYCGSACRAGPKTWAVQTRSTSRRTIHPRKSACASASRDHIGTTPDLRSIALLRDFRRWHLRMSGIPRPTIVAAFAIRVPHP